MKKCPFCAEEIQEEAQKCKHCGEFLKSEKHIKAKNVIGNYEKWLKQNYPAYNIVSKDEEDKSIVLNKKYKSFNILLCLLLCLFWVLPGLIYALVTLLNEKIITLTIHFDDSGRAIKISQSSFKFLMENYNKNLT